MDQERAELEALIRDREEQIKQLQPEAARLRAERQEVYDAFQQRTDEIEARFLSANLVIVGDQPQRPLKKPDVKPRKVTEPWRRRDIRTHIPEVAWVRPLDTSQLPEYQEQQRNLAIASQMDMDVWKQEETGQSDLPPEPPMMQGKVWDSNFMYTPTTSSPHGPLHQMGLMNNLYPSTRPPREVWMKNTCDSYFQEKLRLQQVVAWTDHADFFHSRDFSTQFQHGGYDSQPVQDVYAPRSTWLGAAPQPQPIRQRSVTHGPAGAAERIGVTACYKVFGGGAVRR